MGTSYVGNDIPSRWYRIWAALCLAWGIWGTLDGILSILVTDEVPLSFLLKPQPRGLEPCRLCVQRSLQQQQDSGSSPATRALNLPTAEVTGVRTDSTGFLAKAAQARPYSPCLLNQDQLVCGELWPTGLESVFLPVFSLQQVLLS